MAQIQIAGQTYEVPAQYAPTKVVTDVASATVTYICEAPIGSALTDPVWRISRQTISGNVTTLEWADNAKWSQIAANRASLTYS